MQYAHAVLCSLWLIYGNVVLICYSDHIRVYCVSFIHSMRCQYWLVGFILRLFVIKMYFCTVLVHRAFAKAQYITQYGATTTPLSTHRHPPPHCALISLHLLLLFVAVCCCLLLVVSPNGALLCDSCQVHLVHTLAIKRCALIPPTACHIVVVVECVVIGVVTVATARQPSRANTTLST